MRKTCTILALLMVSVFALSSCKTVETTSAMLHNEHGNYDKAIEMAKLALVKNPNDAEAHFQLGISYSYTGDMAGSYTEFQTAGRLDPRKLADVETNIKSNWAKHFNSGLSEYQNANAAGAAHEFELATEADPRQIKGWLNLAKVFYAMAENDSTYLDKAYAAVDTLLSKNKKEDSEYGNVLALSGPILARRGTKDRALKTFEELLLDDPTRYEVVENAAVGYLNDKDWETGAALLHMVIDAEKKTNSESFESYYNLGAAYLNLKDFPKAIEGYQEALRIDPENKKGMFYLLLTNYQGKNYDDAILVGQEYTTKYPDDANGWRILGLVYKEKGMKIKAEEAMKKAADLAQ
jgi:tetratricopeptide (TPR) repeat protein